MDSLFLNPHENTQQATTELRKRKQSLPSAVKVETEAMEKVLSISRRIKWKIFVHIKLEKLEMKMKSLILTNNAGHFPAVDA